MIGNDTCLLDTSIIILALKKNPLVGRKLDELREIFVPLTAVGELFYGAYKSPQLLKHLQETNAFLKKCTVLHPDVQTSELYGKTKAALERKGNRIPENDIWIAAIALQHHLPLYQNDKHFKDVDGLQLFNPLSSI